MSTRRLFAAAVAVALAGACQKGDQAAAGDTARHGADTNVTTRQVKDTTIVTHDTTVRSDTIVKRGGVDTGAARGGKRRP